MQERTQVSEVPSDFVPTASDLFAHSIDKRFSEDVHMLGEYGVQLFERMLSSQGRNEIPQRAPVFSLLLNALTTATAALMNLAE